MSVPLGRSGKRLRITGESAIEARDSRPSKQPTLGSFKCKTCGFTALSARGLGLHTNIKQGCSVVATMKKAESKARFSGDKAEQSAAKKARLAETVMQLAQGLQSEVMANMGRRLKLGMEEAEAWLAADDDSKTDARRTNKGSAVRKSYTFVDKLRFIEDYEEYHDTTGKSVSEFVRLRSLKASFNKNLSDGKFGWRHPETRAKLVKAAAESLKKACKIVPSKPRYPKAEAELHSEAKQKCKKGRKVSGRWIQVRARQLMAKHYPGQKFVGRRSYQRRACKRWGFVPRKTTNFRASTTLDKLPFIRVYHKELRFIVKNTADIKEPEEPSAYYDEKWGRFAPHKRAGGDQVPLEFITGHFDTTWTKKGEERVEVRTPSDALRKRFCTGHLHFYAKRPVEKQPKVALVFRGKGLRISDAEKAAYHPRTRIVFQPKAWVDRPTLAEITKGFLKDEEDAYGIKEPGLWLGDNLDCQTRPEFRAQMAEGNFLVKNYPPGTSDKGPAPVDNGMGKAWKAKSGELQERDLEDEVFADSWDNNTMTASDKRIKISHWAGEAWDLCLGQENLVLRCLEKAGAMMTMDGTGDDLIALEGLPEGFKYEFMDAEIDTEDPAEDDLEEEEEEENEAEIPDMDIEETPLSELFEDVTEDTTELELCMDDPDAPPGFQLHDLCPDVGNKKYMLGKHVLFRWDCGWAHGVVKRRHTKGKVYNYFVLYKNDDGSSDQWRHGLFSSNYYDAESQPDGVWVMLIPRATYSDEE